MATESMKGKSLITLEDLSTGQILTLIHDAILRKQMKRNRVFPRKLQHSNIGLIFLRPSCRTRASFMVAATDEGAHPHVFAADELRFGSGESIKDIARVLGRLFDGIAIRSHETSLIEEVAAYAGVPVWNAMSNEHHPTQVLADLMTIAENGIDIEGAAMAYVGHGRGNVVISLMAGAAKMGMELRLVAPPGTEPEPELVARLFGPDKHPKARLIVTDDPEEGLDNAQVVYGDMWVYMDTGEDIAALTQGFRDYRITRHMMRLTGRSDTILLHCLPSQHNLETAFARAHPYAIDTEDAVFEGPRNRAFDQAENRMHTIKALMLATI
jgi:ornithine carbamoyltransferase